MDPHPELIEFRNIGYDAGPEWDSVGIVPVLEEFGFVPGHIHVAGAFALAAFAR
jgi:hypothetical protein